MPRQPSVRNVALAVRLARHTARGWDNAAIPDDVADIAALLNLSYGGRAAVDRRDRPLNRSTSAHPEGDKPYLDVWRPAFAA